MKKRIVLLFLSMFLFYAFACSSDDDKQGFMDNMLSYQEIKEATFTVSGNATCTKCQADKLPIDAMQIEIFEKDNPLDRLALKLYGSVGPFTIPNIVGPAGKTLSIHGKLLRQGGQDFVTAYYGYAEVVAPEEDGQTVSTTLNFPSSEPTE